MKFKLMRLSVSVLLALLSTAVMSYISMATPIGPWIDTTLVLCSMLIFTLLGKTLSRFVYTSSVSLTTAAGSLGGILATGAGFSLPTLYFVDRPLFDLWMSQPLYFASMISVFSFVAGSFGLLVAHLFQDYCLIKQELPFPIGELIYKTIAAQGQLRKAIELAGAFIATSLSLYIRQCTQFIADTVVLVDKHVFSLFSLPQISLPIEQMPIYLAVGFVTGHVIATPLLVGLFSKIFCIEPLYALYMHSHFLKTTGLTLNDFILAFGSGMVLYGAVVGFLDIPKLIKSVTKNIQSAQSGGSKSSFIATHAKAIPLRQAFVALTGCVGFLTYCNFSPLAQVYVLVFSFVCTYQLVVIAGKIGLAPLGRFATFVMVPGMFLFGFDKLQTVLVAAFVEIAGGVASDALFGRKTALLASIDMRRVVRYQWFGLFVSSCAVGGIFWLLIAHFGLGAEGLAVSKAAGRALLINIQSFDLYALAMGFIFGFIVSYTSISAPLLLGGIVMPPYMSLLLICGGFLAYAIKNKEDYYPLCSGIFAASSIWMLIKAFLQSGCAV
ncbi:OPT/YSL family transporter [Candidatus Dependentiae bacterium]|nr:OPT/YSL family transporter [Candidatus Dependentiae bacterium]